MDENLREVLERYRMKRSTEKGEIRHKKHGSTHHRLFYGTELDEQCIRQSETVRKYARTGGRTKGERRLVLSERTERAAPALEEYVDEIMRSLKETKGVVIKGGTGVGKSTQVPKHILAHLRPHGLIGCTQPRRIAAVSIAGRMKKEIREEDVGYKIRFEDEKGNRIRYMTEGILLSELKKDPEIRRFSAIVLDEVHEKSAESLVLLRHISGLVRKRNDLYLVVMSATIEEDVMKEIGMYRIIEITHERHPVKITYLQSAPEDYIAEATKRVVDIARNPEGNILVFLTGVEDIEVCHNILREKFEKMKIDMEIAPLHAKLPLEKQREAVSSPYLRCILATNIAETSITIPNARYVVDCGMYKEVVYCPGRNTWCMATVPIQKPMAEQRAGRTGRTGPGECFRIYTEEAYESLKDSTVGRVETENLEHFYLSVLDLEIPFSVNERIEITRDRLRRQNVLNGGCITDLGKEVLGLPVSVTHGAFLIEGRKRGCGWECAVIVAMIETYGNRYEEVTKMLKRGGTGGRMGSRAGREKEQEEKKTRDSDHLALLEVYMAYRVQFERRKKGWKRWKECLDPEMNRAEKIIEQVCGMLSIEKKSSKGRSDVGRALESVRRDVLEALFVSHSCSVCELVGSAYQDRMTGVEPKISRKSLLYFSEKVYGKVIYNEVVEIGLPIMKILTGYEELG